MNRNKLSEARFIVSLLTLIGTLSVFSFVQAGAQATEDQPYWGVEQNPQLSIEKENYHTPANAGEYCTQRSYLLEVIDRGIPTLTQREDCAITTPFGELTDGKLLKFKHATTAYEIDAGGVPVLVPNNDAYFYTSHIGNNRHGLFAFENPVRVFEKRAGMQNGFQGVQYRYEYFVRDGHSPRALQRTVDGSLIGVGAVDASQNGQWLIANLGAGRVGRIDSENFQLVAFPGSYPQYSGASGTQPDLAITNDGRYAALSGGYNTSYNFSLYDLSACRVPDAADNLSVAEHCRQRELTGYMQEHIQGFLYAEHLQFSSDGTQLYLTARLQDGTAQRVTLTAPGQEVQRLSYLALGDSFSSGEGDRDGARYYEPGTDGSEEYPSEKCHLSRRSYPYLLAGSMGIPSDLFRSVACSGADSNDITNTSNDEDNGFFGHFDQFEGFASGVLTTIKRDALAIFAPGREAQIKFLEKYKPEAITIGLGGNDIGFGQKLVDCIFSEITNINASCARALTEGSARANDGYQIRDLYYDLKGLYESLHNASEKTKIYVIGYPNIVKTGTVCNRNVFLDGPEREYAVQTVRYLNSVIRAAATDAGAHYIDIENSLDGIELCSGVLADIGVNAMTPGNDHFFLAGNESYHPNERGHMAIAAAIQRAVPDMVDNPSLCNGSRANWCPSGNDSPPPLSDYFIYENDSFLRTLYNHSIVKDVIQFPYKAFDTAMSYLSPGTRVSYVLHSEPVSLGEFTADENGEVKAQLTIPATIPAGFHELHAIGTLPSGERVDQYEIILVGHSEEDIDGDGILNESDKCMFVQPANIDEDHDGNDDACDPFIDQPQLPGKPTVELPAKISTQNHTAVAISGEAEEGTTALVKIDDTNEATAAVTAEAHTAAAPDGNFKYSTSVDVSSLADGVITASVTLKNDQGEGEGVTATAQKDTAAPQVLTRLDRPANDAGWHRSDVAVLLSAEDVGSGVEKIRYSTSGAVPSDEAAISGAQTQIMVRAEGVTTITYRAVDMFGNESLAASLEVRVDTAAPVVTINKDKNPAYVQLLGKELSGTANDMKSGTAGVKAVFEDTRTGNKKMIMAQCFNDCNTWRIAPYSLFAGQYVVSVIAVDTAGNEGFSVLEKPIIVVSFPTWLSRWLL